MEASDHTKPMKLTRVTVTGADDSIHPGDIFELSAKYPFAEWGLLLSRNWTKIGAPRFPSQDWLNRLDARLPLKGKKQPINISAHICGKWVHDIMLGKWTVLESNAFILPFQRIQLNFHGQPHKVDKPALEASLHDERLKDKQLIFQRDNVNNHLMIIGSAPLFDLSHGAGLLPDAWPKAAPFAQAGYAGGLSPDNVATELEKIAKVCGGAEIWIDCETHVRSNNDMTFDLDKVEAFLKAAEPFVYQQ